MGQDQSWVIQTSDLQVGTVLGFDLLDGNGRLLIKAGLPLSDRVLETLRRRGVHTVTVRGRADTEEKSSNQLLLEMYDPAFVAQLQQSVNATEEAVISIARQIRQHQFTTASELHSSLDQLVSQIEVDVSATLGVIVSQSSQIDNATLERIAGRSTRLSVLSMTTSFALGMNKSDVVNAGLSGLLHDISLALHPEWFESLTPEQKRRFQNEFQRHPLESFEILSTLPDVPDKVKVYVTQVHEQIDGSGFPRGLKGTQLQVISKIINVCDAYLELVDPMFRSVPIIPGDAVPYLCYQAALGRFDREIVQGFVKAMSIYPIGSLVELADSTHAVVVRSNEYEPLKPVVRRLDRGHELIDLRTSENAILGPIHAYGENESHRIPKHRMSEVLWGGLELAS